MKVLFWVLTTISVALVILGVASIESTPIIIPLLMVIGGGAWLVYASNAYKLD